MGLLSLTTAFAFFANIFFILFWLLSKKKWRSLIGLVTLLVFIRIFIPVFGWNFFSLTKPKATVANGLKVMHWNVHALGLYEGNGAKEKARQMEDVIKENNPDILCLAEYDVNGNDSMEPHTMRIMEENGFKSYCFKKDNEFESDKNIHLGTAIFSKYPLKNFVAYPLDKRRRLIENGASYLLQADVELPENKTLRVFALHLYSSGISNNDINYIEKLKGRKTEGSARPDYDEDFLYELNRRGINPDDHFRVFIFKLS
ncbi:MAG: endonuclease/exonuclease/phosphatase family protein, partial [Flavipsychrobacter sp.]